ncbi:MAG: hypothetical protein RLZZ344_650 [Pseudomonadota bacterium]|jgi:broad specificity phosphatase PhoE
MALFQADGGMRRTCVIAGGLALALAPLAGFSAAWAAGAEEALSPQRLAELLRKEPGLVILVRHAETESGIGDPPNFRLEDCSTQRNLSAAGRAQSRQMGEWFAAAGLLPAAVRSSLWCRCLDTAKEAFGRSVPVTAWPALNSTFQGRGDSAAQQAQIRSFLQSRYARSRSHQSDHQASIEGRPESAARPRNFEVWVTHQVLISALTGRYISMGELVLARPDAQGRLQVVGRLSSDFR